MTKRQMLAIIYNQKFANDYMQRLVITKYWIRKHSSMHYGSIGMLAIMQGVEPSKKHLSITIIDAQIDI